MVDKKEKKFYTEILTQSYKTDNVNEISQIIQDKLGISISPNEVREILSEDYELECRKMMYNLELSYALDY